MLVADSTSALGELVRVSNFVGRVLYARRRNIPDLLYILYVFLAHIDDNRTEISKEKHLFSLELRVPLFP
jgi:hypothetical protein